MTLFLDDEDQKEVITSQRILVVDDNRDSADSLGMLLKFMGADTHIVYDGQAALAALKTYKPSICFLDIGMPGMNGYEVARRTRELPEGKYVKLVALTGWGQEKDRRLSMEAGINYHLTKPVDDDILLGLLTSISQPLQKNPAGMT